MHLGRGIVFVVEDEKNLWEIIRRVFERDPGLKLVFAESVAAGEEIFERMVRNGLLERLAAVLMDGNAYGFTMPLVRSIRKRWSGPMAAISGDPDLSEQLLQEGCTVNLGKPFHLHQLIEFVEHAVQARTRRSAS